MKYQAKNLPKKVEDLVKEIEEKNPSYDEAKTWATAWSVYCKHVSPGSDHCQKGPEGYLKKKAGFSSLGTPWRFTEIAGPRGVLYGITVGDEQYRIIQERDHWRLDYRGTLGYIWEAVTSTEYPTAQAAAKDLVQLHRSRKLVGQKYASDIDRVAASVAAYWLRNL